MIPKEIDILGVPLSTFASYEEVEDSIVSLMESNRKEPVCCVAINPEKIYHAQHNPGLMAHLRSAKMHICDGVGAAMAARILHGIKTLSNNGYRPFSASHECCHCEEMESISFGRFSRVK